MAPALGPTAVVVGVVALLASLAVHVQNDFAPLDIYAPVPAATGATATTTTTSHSSGDAGAGMTTDTQANVHARANANTNANATAEELFSETYYHARALFRAQTQAAGAALFTHTLDGFAHLDLTIDFAVLAGVPDRVVVHVSGTHGVEGFAGSAIQSALLQRAAHAKSGGASSSSSGGSSGGSGVDSSGARTNADPPTVIFVHALNAYGFSQLRRFNEHNVDLNRNWLSPAQFEAFAAQDPNANGYMDLFDVLNPTRVGGGGVLKSFWIKTLYHLATKGFAAVKRALVSGTYHFPRAIYFGGTELQPSLRILREFLQQHVQFERVRAFSMIDVHTGLGPAGFDTLLVGTPHELDGVAHVFGDHARRNKNVASVHGTAGNGVAEGYESTAGFIVDGVAEMLPARALACSVLLAQEFGTVPGVFIVKAVSEENAAFHYAPAQRLPFAEKLRDVFYLHRSASWRAAVVERGVAVFDQLYKHVATCAE